MALNYSKKLIIEQVQRQLNNGFPDTDFKTSANEILLFIDQKLAFDIVGKAYDAAKIDGDLSVPDAFYITEELPTPVFNITHGWYETTLPQAPVSLPLGYSISRVFFANGTFGESQDVYLIKAKRVSYRNKMPLPNGVRGFVEGGKIKLISNNGQPIDGLTLFATYAFSRTNNITDPLNLPDDVIGGVIDFVVNKIIQRMQLPMDIIKDNLPAGNKSS